MEYNETNTSLHKEKGNDQMNITESKLFKEFSRVAPRAYSYGFTFEDVKELLEKIEDKCECSPDFVVTNHRQNALKMIMTRLDLKRDDFFKHIEERKSNPASDKELEKDSGKYYLEAYKSMLN